MFFLLLPQATFAAEVTRMPSALEGSAGIRYSGSAGFGGLVEAGERIADRRTVRHDVDFALELAPIDGVALTLGLSMTPGWSWKYPDARAMLLEPVEGGGSYAFGEVQADSPTVQGGGTNGIWLGLGVTPFSEAFEQNHKVTWRLDGSFRTGNKKNRWTVIDGKRGAAPGGTALRLSGAFSRRGGPAEPYLRARWHKESKVTTDVVDMDGVVWATGLELRPASTVDLLGGTEIIAAENGESVTTVDVFIGFGYRSWEDVPSGLLLPNVIDASKGIAVTHGETIQGIAGLGLNIQYTRNLRSSAGARFEYALPHTQEHVYDVATSPDSFGIGWYVSITGVLAVDDLSGD